MAIPSYQELMLPVLRVLDERGLLPSRVLAMLVADKLGLTQEEKGAMLPSGSQLYIVNRTGRAAWYMQHAGLTSRPKRGHFDITGEGKKLLASNPSLIDDKLLATYPSFVGEVLKQKTTGRAGGSCGRDYTLRLLIQMVQPCAGKRVYKPTSGFTGFLCASYDYFKVPHVWMTGRFTHASGAHVLSQRKSLAYAMYIFLHVIKSMNIVNLCSSR